MTKHAYLIIAHEQPLMLQRLIGELDDERNDIYVHIDRKALFDGSDLHAEKSNLIVLEKRIDGRWGDYSLVEIEFALLRTATEQNHYKYYHLLSGVDLPVKPQNVIHTECQQLKDTEFIGLAQNDNDRLLRWSSQHRFLFCKNFKSRNIIVRTIRRAWALIQSAVGYRRYRKTVKRGSQWWSITDSFAQYAINMEDEIKRDFKGTFCPDEMVFQTLCWNSEFRNRVYSITDEFNGCKRWIKWVNGELIPLDESMIAEAKKSTAWFARKLPAKI